MSEFNATDDAYPQSYQDVSSGLTKHELMSVEIYSAILGGYISKGKVEKLTEYMLVELAETSVKAAWALVYAINKERR